MIVLLYHALHTHQREGCLVNMVGKQLAFPCQSERIDTVALEDADGKQRADAHDHQRDEELVTACQFGYQEDARQRCMHHARHYTCHAHQRKVLLRNINAYLVDVPDAGEEEASKTADEKRWSKGSATTA